MKIFLVLKMYKLTANLVNACGTSCSTITMSRNQPTFFEKKLKGSFMKRLSVVKRTAEATGLSLRTIN